MLSKTNKRRLCPFENEPPDKKLVSDADIFIKQLAEKQTSTKTNLLEQLNTTKNFEKLSEFQPLTNYTAGCSSLSKFTEISINYEEIEKLKSFALTKSEIDLYLDSKKGNDYIKTKHKNINEDILNIKLKEIRGKLGMKTETRIPQGNERLMSEHMLSTKPNSMETKLLKFVIENKSEKQKIPHPMDNLKAIEQNLFNTEFVNIKQIRKKARSLNKQIEELNNKCEIVSSFPVNNCVSFAHNSQWDLREKKILKPPEIKKVYTCKPQNLYTIKNGKIVKLSKVNNDKLSEKEIKQIEKFKNYEAGIPSKTLFIKNIAKGVTENDLETVFSDLEGFLTMQLMKGKMRGQAFVEFTSENFAAKSLNEINGKIIKDKPIIVMFSKR